MSEVRRIGRHSLIYGGGALLGRLAGFLMLPVYTSYLSPSDYGVLELLGMTVDIIAMVAGAGLAGALFRFHAEAPDLEQKRDVMGTVAFGSAGLAAITCVAGMLVATPVTRLLFDGDTPSTYLRVFFLTYFFQALEAPGFMLLRIQQRPGAFVTLNLLRLIGSLSLNIYFVVVRGWGLEGVLTSMVIVGGLTAAYCASYVVRYTGYRFSWARFRDLTRFGAPLVLAWLGSFVLTYSDRYFLNHFRGTAEVGLYSLAYRFTFVLASLTAGPFQQAWVPRQFEIAQRTDANALYSRMFFYLSVALLGGAAAMVAVIEDTVRIMSAPPFHAAYRIVPVVLIATVLQHWTTFSSIGLQLAGRTGTLARASAAAVMVSLFLNLLLIPKWGVMGAAWSTVVAYAVRFYFVLRASQLAYRIDYPWRRVLSLGVVASIVFLMRELLRPADLASSIALSAALVLATALCCYRLLTQGEREALQDILSRAAAILRGRTAPQAP